MIANHYALLYDPEVFGVDAEVFNPCRFFDDDGTAIKTMLDRVSSQFGIGKLFSLFIPFWLFLSLSLSLPPSLFRYLFVSLPHFVSLSLNYSFILIVTKVALSVHIMSIIFSFFITFSSVKVMNNVINQPFWHSTRSFYKIIFSFHLFTPFWKKHKRRGRCDLYSETNTNTYRPKKYEFEMVYSVLSLVYFQKVWGQGCKTIQAEKMPQPILWDEQILYSFLYEHDRKYFREINSMAI